MSVSVDLTLCRNLSGLARCDQTSTNAADQHLLFLRSLAAGCNSTCLILYFLSKSPHNSYTASSDQENFLISLQISILEEKGTAQLPLRSGISLKYHKHQNVITFGDRLFY